MTGRVNRNFRIDLKPQCATCLMQALTNAVKNSTDDHDLQFELIKYCLKEVSRGFELRHPPAQISVELLEYIRQKTNNLDPYKELKKKSNRIALELMPKMYKKCDQKDKRLKFECLVSLAITGNLIDFATGGFVFKFEELEHVFQSVLDKGFTVDDSKEIIEDLPRFKKVLYILDNAGEIVFDIPLIEFLIKENLEVTAVVKEGPMMNDATIEDANEVGLDKITNVITTGAAAMGTPISRVSEAFLNEVKNSDLIISKGQANLETFPEIQRKYHKPTIYILRTKCEVISKALGVPMNSNVLLYINTKSKE